MATLSARDGSVSPANLRDLFGGDAVDATVLERLRVLQNRTRVLDEGGRSYLAELLASHWDGEEPDAGLGALTVLMDVVLESAADTGLRDRLAGVLARRLNGVTDPAKWAPFGYLLMDGHWRCA